MDLLLGSSSWGDDFGPAERRSDIRYKLERGVPPADDEHIDEIFDMESELRDLALQMCNSRLQLARQALTEQAALVSYKTTRDEARRIIRRTRELLSVPVDEDYSYRLESCTSKMRFTLTEYEEESTQLLRLLRARIPSLGPDKEDRGRGRKGPRKATGSTASARGGGGGSSSTGVVDATLENDEPNDNASNAASPPASATSAVDDGVDRDETMEGYLMKKKKDKGGQKKRWIICSYDSMTWFDKRDGKELGRLALSGCRATAKKDEDGSHMMLDTEDTSYIFSFVQTDEMQPTMDQWSEFVTKRSKMRALELPNGADDLASVSGGAAAASSLSSTPTGGDLPPLPKKPAAPENESIEMFFAGYLLKRKEKNGKFSAPKKRYCLVEDNVMRYLEGKGGKELGAMAIDEMKIALVSTEDGDSLRIKIHGETYSFLSDTQPYIGEWVQRLQEKGAGKIEASDGGRQDDGTLQAYLNKRKDKGHGKWTSPKKRWCICDGKNLTYYEKRGAPELGSLSLKGATVSVKTDDDGVLVMVIKTDDTSHAFGNIDGSSMEPWVFFINKTTGQSGAPSLSESSPESTLPVRDRRARSTISRTNTTVRNTSAASLGGAAEIEDGSSSIGRRRLVSSRENSDSSGLSTKEKRASRLVSARSASAHNVSGSVSPRAVLPPSSTAAATNGPGGVSPRAGPRGNAPSPAAVRSPRSPRAPASPGSSRGTVRGVKAPPVVVVTPGAGSVDEFGI